MNTIFQKVQIGVIARLFLNKLVLSALISILIFLVFVFNIDKYKAELVFIKKVDLNNKTFYQDLNNDGNSEKIEFVLKYPKRTAIMIFSKEMAIDQWNFDGEFANMLAPIFIDFDNDGIQEIVFFTTQNDTLLMHSLDVFNNKIEILNKAVCKLHRFNGKYDFTIFPCAGYDVNADGYKEIFFSITTGFSMQPRNMFAYYPATDSILVSPKSFSVEKYHMAFDLDGDKIPEFFSSINQSPGNCKTEEVYSDMYNWLMVFTPEMKFKFPPVKLGDYPSISRIIPMNCGTEKYILVTHCYRGQKNDTSYIALFNSKGKIVCKKNIKMEDESWFYIPFFSRDSDYEKVFILQGDGTIYSVDSSLNFKFEKKINKNYNTMYVKKVDIDCDNEDEIIVQGKNYEELKIYRNDLSNPVTLEFYEYHYNDLIQLIKKTGNLPKIFIQTKLHQYTFTYENTFLYKFRYALFVPIFLLILFSFFVIQKIREFRKLKVEKIQKQISELQVKSIQNQLDPHFTFNIFASFANLINEKDTERANYIFNKYAALLKANVINCDTITISLQQELDFVESYLELEQFRHAGKFCFTISIQETVDRQLIVPKMILHIFVENAIKHGLKHLDKGGELLITGVKIDGVINISISDNGIGRAKAKEIGSFSTGKGLSIMDKIIEYYHQLYNSRITYKIIDLYENSHAFGTEVVIEIPVDG
jgi:hypothetical protein